MTCRQVFAIAALIAALLAFTACTTAPVISPAARADLAPTGVLRAGINYGNGVLATRDAATGAPVGIAVNLATELGRRLDVPVELVMYEQAGNMVEGIKAGAWDVAFLAIDPLRANVMDFTAPYGEIEGAYLVPGGSRIRNIADVDRDGVRVAVVAKSNYDLFLTRNLQHAELVRIPTTHGSADVFAAGKVDVLAGVRQRVDEASRNVPGSRLLDGRFMVIRQAVAVPKGHAAGLQYVREFVEDIKESGLVAREFEKADVRDAAVAPPASVR